MKRPGCLLTALLFPLILLAAACDLLVTPSAAGTPTAAPATSTAPAATADATTDDELFATPQPPAAPATLRVWLPPELGARTDAGSRELAAQVRAFQTAHRGLEVRVEQKPVEGAGGILGYLRTGRSVAPSIMPDLVAVPTHVLTDPAVRDLFVPLDGLVDAAQLAGVYPGPAAQVSGERLMGWPFAGAGLSHLVYQPDAVDGPVPMIWSDFISDTNHTLVLPADSRDGALFGLQFYLAEGGGLTNDAGQLALEPEALARALSQIALNRENLLQSRQMKTLDEAWQYFQTGLSDFVWTRSEFLLGQGATMAADRAYARVPGPNGPLTPLTTTWAWAITTTDPARQALAADLLLALTTPAELAQWAGAAQLLPARREAMALLAEDNSYYRFADGELERAQVLPVSESSRLMNVMGDAVFQSLTTDTSPALIAEEAAAALRQ